MTNLKLLKEPPVVETLPGFVLVNYIGDFLGLAETGLSFRITNVAFDENLNHSVISSIGLLADTGCSNKFMKDRAEIADETKTHKLVAKRGQNKLYWLSFTANTNVVKLGSTPDTTMEWHRKLGHPSYQTMMEMPKHGLVDGLPKEMFKKWNQCLECNLGKLSEKITLGTTKVQKSKATRRFEKVHVDLVGPLPTGKGGFRFMLTLVDDYTKYKWTFFICKKSQVTEVIKAWLKRMNNLTSRKLINFKTDQGNKFVNSSLKEELENLGVVHDVSPKHHPSMNGAVERWNRTLQDGYKVLLIDSGLTADYWPYAAKCFTYLHNKQFSRVSPEAKTPFELMYLRKPQVDHLFEFGRLGATRSGKQQKKGKMKGGKTIFLGYKDREYLVYWLHTKKVGTARWSEIDTGNVGEGKRVRNAVGFTAKALELLPPKNFAQITGRKDATEWLKAYNQEVESLECIGEFDVVQLRDVPVGVKPLPLKELFTIKDRGRKKVRLAVKGDLEKPTDDEDNYAPTGRFEIVRLLISVAASKGWKIRSLDVKNAYLYGKSEKEI
eukprot:augustus_masked-scaffold_88-processed-gene-0.52-mRNA-1 protein AED:1.00 eAED:1.00 QI:0/0/0/0/1/1/2/0/550